jgi:DNA polymerase I-like protein with 3'-5' exonuclease and polymerase domains
MNINPKTHQAYQLLHNGTLALGRAERAGIRVDLNYIQEEKQRLTDKIEQLEDELKQTKFYRRWEHTVRGRININSNPQLAHYLYKTKGLLPPHETVTGQGATDESALKQLDIPELDMIIEIRKLRKIRDTYLEGFEREAVRGYIHPSFNLHLVRTYRSSSDRPNFQNIPIRDEQAMQSTRRALYPRPGHQLLEVDFKALEVSIAACYHHDPNMIHYVKNPSSDMHRDMAEQIFMFKYKGTPEHKRLRNAAKNGFVFPQFYGDYYKNCATNLAEWGELSQSAWRDGQGVDIYKGNVHLSTHLRKHNIKSFKVFTQHIKEIEDDFWNNRFPDYRDWKTRWWQTYQKHGYIDMLTGFRCSGVMTRNDVVNYPIQGSAFHCLLWTFIEGDRVAQKKNWDSRLIGQIHDSAVVDVHPDELKYVAETFQRVACEELPKTWEWIEVPLRIDMELCPVDGSWAEKESYEI